MRSDVRVGILLVVAGFCVSAGWVGAQESGSQTADASLPRRSGIHQDATVRGPSLGVVPRDFEKLRIAPGFLLAVSVLGDEDYNGTFRVDAQGNISIAVLGTLPVAGATASEVREALRARLLAQRLMVNPQVTVSILEYVATEVVVLGEVGAPGKYPLLAPHSLLDVLAGAGGLTQLAGNQILIAREQPGEPPTAIHFSRGTLLSDAAHALVQPGDTVQVGRAGIVYVLGGVNRAGGFVMQEDGNLSLLQAVAEAGGTTVSAATKSAFLLRRNADGTVQLTEVPLRNMTRGKAPDVALQPQDIVYVPVNGLKEAFINVETIIASAASASIYAGWR